MGTTPRPPDRLTDIATAVLRRLRDPEADFELQALIRGETESLWLTRRGPRLLLQVLGGGGGELEWERSAFRAHAPERAFAELADRIELVTLFAGGPLPDELLGLFLPDEAGTGIRYRAEWEGWDAFQRWLGPGSPSPP
jgi:hypothetical protein